MKLKDAKDDKDLIAFGEDFFERSAKAKRKAEQSWLLSIAFLAGDQLARVNQVTGALERIDTHYDPEWVVRIIDNRILPVYRLMASKLTKNRPLPSAKAHSAEEGDIQAARAAIKILEYHWSTLELDTVHTEMANWLTATGNCFYKQFWNPEKGERVLDMIQVEMDEELNQDGTPRLSEEVNADFTLGDTDLLLRSPFNIYPQPGKTKFRDMTMCGDAEIMDVDEIEELYGKKVSPERDAKYVKIHRTMGQTPGTGLYDDGEAADNSATIKELYILPCSGHPDGLVLRWANDVLLSKDAGCKEIPITHFGLIEVPGQLWYKGIVEDLIPLQKRWNTLLSKIEQHNDIYNDPPVVVDPRTINIDDWTNEPGLILEKLSAGGDPPFVLPVPKLDVAVFKELDILDAQFEIVPVLNKVSYGKDTPHATSGTAINFLQEKDNDVVRPLIDNIEAGYADVFRRDFKLCQDNYAEDRGFAVVGEDNKVEWIEFTQADLETELDITVEAGSAMPRSKVAQQALVMDMLKAGFFSDPETGRPDFAKAMKYMEFGSVDDIYKDNALDTNQAQRENERMKEGIMAVAEDWHNHQAHIYEHNRLRKTAEYEELDDGIKEMFAAHVEHHMSFLQPQGQGSPGGELPQPEELEAFVRGLPDDIKAQLQALPPEQMKQAVLELFDKHKHGQV